MNDAATPTMGDNLPPATDTDALLIRLREDHVNLLKRRDELLAAIERTPSVIAEGDEEMAGRMADFVDQINAFIKAAKIAHQDEKAPFLAAGRTVDSFLHALVDDPELGKAKANKVRKTYADAKAARERRAREEEERRAREAAALAQRKADEAAARLKEEADLEAALEAEEAAKQAALEVERAAKAAAAKPAELGKSRGELGGQTSLKQFWNFRDLNRNEIDLESLRHHFTTDSLEKALRSWINANKDALKAGTRLEGVEVFEDTRL